MTGLLTRFMLKTLSLILPILIPSWRFFKTIEPSPRVQWALLQENGSAPQEWKDFRPLPLVMTPLNMIFRLFWNPDRNDELFVVSCAERIREQPTSHSIDEIKRRLQSDVESIGIEIDEQLLQFRLIFVHRDKTQLVQEIVFVSDVFPAKATQKC